MNEVEKLTLERDFWNRIYNENRLLSIMMRDHIWALEEEMGRPCTFFRVNMKTGLPEKILGLHAGAKRHTISATRDGCS